jgi:hypothetical protein
MSNTFYGSSKTGVVRSTVFDPRDGYRYVERLSGTPETIGADFNAAVAAGYRCRYDPDAGAGYATLEVEVGRDPSGGTEELSNEWYLLGNDLEKSLFEHPDVVAIFKDEQTPEQAATFRADVEAVMRGTKEYSEFITGVPAVSVTVIDRLIKAMANGQETFFVSQFVLRNTMVLPTNYSGFVDISNVNRKYTTAQLFAAESVAMPLIPALASLDGQWLKKTPTFEQQGRDKWRVDREWWHAETWSDFYQAAT